MRTFRRSFTGIALLAGLTLAPSSAAGAIPTWAPAATAPIHPGVQTFTAGGQCTANFVFYSGSTLYIGQAAHCATTGGQTGTNGCITGSLPLGTQVTVGGATKPGVLVYSSWLTMQALHETDANTCQYNDFALVQLDPSDAAGVNPSIPHWGGPNGLNSAGSPLFQRVYGYGNSSLRLGLAILRPMTGISLGDTGAGWAHQVSTITPGVPGDSGNPYLDSTGKALGQLSTLAIGLPTVVSNRVGDLRRELDYMRSRVPSMSGVQLALGTVTFNPNRLPLGI